MRIELEATLKIDSPEYKDGFTGSLKKLLVSMFPPDSGINVDDITEDPPDGVNKPSAVRIHLIFETLDN